MIARFLAMACRALPANRSTFIGRSRSHFARVTSGGKGCNDFPYFPPSRIGVRITPGHMTLTRTFAGAAFIRRDVDRPTTACFEAQ